ncbi:hypothetical protein ES332_D07G216700v1 [Gossypium tomentosum]|uniref:Uncharacterized protein n=1 Tax=Gossypium tomentosum TaxID=34277 RepID=A0A5D2KAY1_GOSTO|nr:hypothetical protein ES332_D07G216700v1 [Gossypium tomentosum]TYH63766.1 hypothetical protein ES332_D07G216700v1 [Gossypium tomentosum]
MTFFPNQFSPKSLSFFSNPFHFFPTFFPQISSPPRNPKLFPQIPSLFPNVCCIAVDSPLLHRRQQSSADHRVNWMLFSRF